MLRMSRRDRFFYWLRGCVVMMLTVQEREREIERETEGGRRRSRTFAAVWRVVLDRESEDGRSDKFWRYTDFRMSVFRDSCVTISTCTLMVG